MRWIFEELVVCVCVCGMESPGVVSQRGRRWCVCEGEGLCTISPPSLQEETLFSDSPSDPVSSSCPSLSRSPPDASVCSFLHRRLPHCCHYSQQPRCSASHSVHHHHRRRRRLWPWLGGREAEDEGWEKPGVGSPRTLSFLPPILAYPTASC